MIFLGSLFGNIPDSLRSVYKHGNDSTKFDATQKLFIFFRNTDIDSAKIYLRKLYAMSTNPKNPFRQGQSYMLEGSLYHRQNKYDSAEVLYNRALQEFYSFHYFKGISSCLNNLGILYEERGNFETAGQFLFRHLRLADSLGDKQEQSTAYVNIGLLFQRQEQYDEALKYYTKGMELKRAIHDKRGQALLYNNMGIVYYYLDDYDKVLDNFKRSLAIFRELNDLRGQALPFFNIGEIYFEAKEDYEKALYYYKKSLDIEQELGDISGQATSLSKIGACYMSMKKYDLAISMQLEALKRLQRTNAPVQVSTVLMDLSNSYEKAGDIKNAFKRYKEYRSIRDSLMNERNTKQIAKIKESYESDKKDQEIAKLNNERTIQKLELENHLREIRNQNTLLLVATIFMLLIAIAGLLLFRMYRRGKQMNELLSMKNLVIEKKSEQLSILYEDVKRASEIKEVFLANTTHELRTPLNVINTFSNQLLTTQLDNSQRYYLEQIKSSSKNLLTVINDLLTLTKLNSGMMRVEKSAFDIRETVKFLKDSYGQKAFEKKIDLEITLGKGFPSHIISDQLRIAQICSNLIDNSIKYTFIGGKVECRLKITNESVLEITVVDNGVGMDVEEQELILQPSGKTDSSAMKQSKLGMGMNIVRNLIHLLGGSLELKSVKNSGSTFLVRIPVDIQQQKETEVALVQPVETRFFNVLLAISNRIDAMVVMDVISAHEPNAIIDCVDDGHKAEQKLQKNEYNLALLDLTLSGKNGSELALFIRTELQGKQAEMPLIALANSHAEIQEIQKKGHGINEFLVKPIEPRNLINCFEKAKVIIDSASESVQDKGNKQLLQKIFFNNPEKMQQVFEFCKSDIPQQLFILDKAIKEGLQPRMKSSLSTIKNTLTYVEDSELNRYVDELSAAIKLNDPVQIERFHALLIKRWQKVDSELREILNGKN
jgi:signal transduction histidine kinase/Tfp pilus assembly protein PilF/DNA-binding NarL/FixJ family response regulator